MAKFLDIEGLKVVWAKIKELNTLTYDNLSTAIDSLSGRLNTHLITKSNPHQVTKSQVGLGNVTNDAQVKRSEMNAASGVATLDANKKLLVAQLPAMKTVNGNSILGSGDITIDLSLYKVVTSLPTTGIDVTKIYLVRNAQSSGGNLYTEYIYTDNKWEELGAFKANVDLAPYLTKIDAENTYSKKSETIVGIGGTADLTDKFKIIFYNANGLHVETDNCLPYASSANGGIMTKNMVKKLDTIETGANFYALPVAGTALGGIKTGYTNSGKNYKVQVDADGNAFVNVPWQDTNTTYAVVTASANGLMSTDMFNKLNGIATGATADSAIPATVIDAICV